MARYEIWSFEQAPKRLLLKDITIAAAEVRLQLLQSLRISEHHWKVQFPISVGSDLRQFTVLRTVYWLEPSKGNGKGIMRSLVLNLSFGSYSTTRWQTSHYKDNHVDRVQSPDLYIYWIVISKSGKDILFKDQETVAVFSLQQDEQSGPVLKSFFTDQYCGWEEDGPLRQLDVHFHPSKPLVAYRAGQSVFLWAFERGKQAVR